MNAKFLGTFSAFHRIHVNSTRTADSTNYSADRGSHVDRMNTEALFSHAGSLYVVPRTEPSP